MTDLLSILPDSSPEIQDAVDERLLAEIFAAQGRSFRGGAVANLEGAPMGKGHGNNGQPYDVETTCYLKPVYAAYDNAVANGLPAWIIILAGVKTLKSFTLEVCGAHHVCHQQGDAAIFFGSEEAASTTATTRILNFMKGTDAGEAIGEPSNGGIQRHAGGIPRFKEKMRTMVSRFDDTQGALKFPDKTFFILSANLGNTQQKNLAFVGLQDAFVTKDTGMIDEMLARMTQYIKEGIFFLESQGGIAGDDFSRFWGETNQGELHVRCPECGTAHIFNWKAFDEVAMKRPEDFMARLPRATVWSIVKKHCGAMNIVANYHAARRMLDSV